MTLPLIKLVTLTIKQLSKPLANGIKNSVKTHSRLSRAIAYPAQGYHKLEQTVRMRLMGWNKKIEVKPLSEEAAVNLGAELLGEFVIFSVAVGTLYAEVRRGQAKDRRKEEDQNAKLVMLQEQITELSVELSKQLHENTALSKKVDLLHESINTRKNK